jgi:O-Antigen ligase
MISRVDRLPAATPGRTARALWFVCIAATCVGLVGWGTQTLVGGVLALWSFCIAAAALALVLPLPYALASPLFAGIFGWLVDMLPLVILVGWLAVTARWFFGVVADRRFPRGGPIVWIAVGLVVWTGLGVLAITRLDFKHFLLLLGIQVLASAAVLVVADALRDQRDRLRLVAGLLTYIIVLSVAVLLQWFGVDVETLQNGETRRRVEVAYGVDAFPNNIGMIKYARSINAGALELRRELERVARKTPELPAFEVFRPKFQAYENSLVVRFQGSARPYEERLNAAGVRLQFDNVGLAPANTVPRMRSFPRNALTYAGICAALFPFAFLWRWDAGARRRRFGVVAIAACLFGAAFSLARGAWVAIAIGIIYLFVDGAIERGKKREVAIAFVIAAIVLTGVFLIKYRVDPVTGRAGGGESVTTRADLYGDTLAILKGPLRYIAVGYGTERPRTESGTVREGARYVPRAGTHSTYLNYLFRTGVPGALGIVALYGFAFLYARRAATSEVSDDRVTATMSAASVVIAAAHAVILSLYVEPVYTLTISLVLGLAATWAPASLSLRLPQRQTP